MDENIKDFIIALIIIIIPIMVLIIIKYIRIYLTRVKIEYCIAETKDFSYKLLNDVMDIAEKEGLYEKIDAGAARDRYIKNEQYLKTILDDYRNETMSLFFRNKDYYIKKCGGLRLSSLKNQDFLYATLFEFLGFEKYKSKICYDVIDINEKGTPVTDFGIFYKILRFSLLYLMSVDVKWAVKGYRLASDNPDEEELEFDKKHLNKTIKEGEWYW